VAGPGVLNATTMTAQRQRQPVRAAFPSARQNLIEARLTVEGRVFRTLIREGATVNELIEKVAGENGGSVEKKYYPEFKTYEITRVRIGDVLLVKGDRGIHFGLGEFGIPFASAGEQIVFPNADELRVRKETSTIGLWMTADNFDPARAADFDRRYGGGARVSGAARGELEKSHGGMRSEKLLLHDNILVINRETGEISTVSEYAAKAEGFAAPQFQTPTYTSVGLTMASERGPLAIPMDGSSSRVPYLFVKTFDGRVTDHISIQFNPLKADAPRIELKEITERRPDVLHFPALRRQAAALDGSSAPPIQSAPPRDARADKPDEPPRQLQAAHPMVITPRLISHFWRHPRLLQKEGIRRLPAGNARSTAPSAPRAAVKAGPQRLAEKTVRAGEKKDAKPRLKTEAPRRRKRKPRSHAPSMPLARKKEAEKPKAAEIIRPAPGAGAGKRARRAKALSSPRVIGKKSEAKRELHGKPRALEAAVPKRPLLSAKPRAPARDAKKKRKKLPAYFRLGLLGLLPGRKRRFSRGRAAAGN